MIIYPLDGATHSGFSCRLFTRAFGICMSFHGYSRQSLANCFQERGGLSKLEGITMMCYGRFCDSWASVGMERLGKPLKHESGQSPGRIGCRSS